MKKQKTDQPINILLEQFWQTFPPIWHATRALTHQTATDEFGITASQFHTLRRIEEGKASVSLLADCMQLSRPSVSRSVDELVNAGLVDRERDSGDRRNVRLFLTASGKKLIESLHKVIGEKMKQKFVNLDEEELNVILAGLSSLQKVFGRQENPLNDHEETT
ncbi:MAG TPA: MarR family transcriptional regulator [Pelolinea sp.]|nr:MarR family transcriptional regulator [Pelolinea sp.]